MALRKGIPLTWSPMGCTDTADGTNSAKGSMLELSNLVPDSTTNNCFVPRPASKELTDFDDFSAPGFISALFVLNGVAYGMIASALNPGQDEPYAYDILSDTFIVITGVTSGNTPNSPPTTGDWIPPTMDQVSTKLLVTHPGFSGTGTNFFGMLDLSTPSSPAWSSTNTATNALPGVPRCVKNFNQRAYFGVDNLAFYSDVLVPDSMTNAGQALTIGDTSPIVAFAPLPISTTSGGVAQGLVAFKNTTLAQITGDAATSNLAQNSIESGVGTFAPLSIFNCAIGIGFIAPDGLRFVTLAATVTEPIGDAGKGITTPFIYTLTPSRICAAYNLNVVRFSVINNQANGNPTQEWWYDISRKIWTGPHTFPASLIQAYGKTFIMAAAKINAKLWQGDINPTASSVYVENGTQLQFNWQTSVLPTTGKMYDNSLKFASVGIESQASTAGITVSARDENNTVLNAVVLNVNATPTIWGAFLWGSALWLGQVFKLSQVPVPWDTNIVFRQLSIAINGNSFTGLKLSNIFLMYQLLGALSR